MVCKCTPEQLRNATRRAVLEAVRATVEAATLSADTFSLYQGQPIRPASWYTTTVWHQGAPRAQCGAEIVNVSLNDTTVVVDILLVVSPVQQ